MNEVFYDEHVEFVTLVLNKTDGSGTSSVSISTDFHAPGTVHTSSDNPAIWPVMAERPTCVRSVGRYAAVRHDIVLSCFAHAPFDDDCSTLASMRQNHQFHGSSATIYYVNKPTGASIPYASSMVRQTVEIINISFDNQGLATIECRDTWFKSGELLGKINETDFPNVESPALGEFIPLIIGQGEAESDKLGPVSQAWWLDTSTNNDGSGTTERATLCTGYAPGSLKANEFRKIYVANRDSYEFNPERWHEMELPVSSGQALFGVNGDHSDPPYDDFLAYSANPTIGTAVVFKSSSAFVLSTVGIWVEIRGSGGGDPGTTDSDGRLVLQINHARDTGETYSSLPVLDIISGPIASMTKPMDTAEFEYGNSSTSYWTFPENVVISPDVYYALTLNWLPTDSTSINYPLGVWADGSSAETEMRRYMVFGYNAFSVMGRAYAASAGILAVSVYGWYSDSGGNTDWDDGASDDYHSLEIYTRSDAEVINFESVSLKTAVRGLEDTSGGDYTGSANALVENPSDVIRMLLLDDQGLGAGLSGSDIDTTSFTDARTRSAYVIKGAIENQISREELILKICRECRLIIYKLRDGKIALYYPRYKPNGIDKYISESRWKDDIQLVELIDTPYSELINDAKQTYAPDNLASITDASFIRKAETSKYAGLQFLNSSDSTDDNTIRENLCSDSETLYGKREVREPFDLFDTADGPAKTQNYLIDRYHSAQKRLSVRVPRKEYQNCDLFDIIKLHHTHLPTYHEASKDMSVYTDDHTSSNPGSLTGGKPLTAYYEGVPVKVVYGGTIEGEIVGISEGGPYMFLTFVTMSGFAD